MSRALDNTSAYRQRRASEGSSPARTSRRLVSLMALPGYRPSPFLWPFLEYHRTPCEEPGRHFFVRASAHRMGFGANNWSADVFPGLRVLIARS